MRSLETGFFLCYTKSKSEEKQKVNTYKERESCIFRKRMQSENLL